MHRMPIGAGLILLIIQILVYFGDDSCGQNCVIDKETLGYTIILNIAIIIIVLIKSYNDNKKH